MTKLQRFFIAVLGMVALGLLISVGFEGAQAYQFWIRPLGASIPTLPTPAWSDSEATPPPTKWTALPYWLPSVTPPSEAFGLPSVTPSGIPLCGGPKLMNILLIGSDTRSTGYTYGLSDVTRVVRVDFVTPRVTTLDFPRDLWVKIPYIASHLNGQDHEKLNQAYLYGNPGDGFHFWNDPSAGPGLLALTLNVNFGVHVDHYLAVNMRTFVKMVDTVGGIDVTFDKPLPLSHDPNMQTGTHHLNGTEALEVVRNRVDGVFSRGDYQNLVLCALRQKLTSPEIVTEIPSLIKAFQASVQTDLSPQSMGQLACLGAQLPRQNIALYSFPEDLFTGGRIYDPVFEKDVFIWNVDFNILQKYVSDFQAGSWPVETYNPSTASLTTSVCK
jgi:LCP family protein required for cell wall assembly